MAATIDEITVSYTEDGVETVKEIDKEILTRGGWCTIMFRLQEWDKKKECYGPDKYAIRRYQKRNGEFKMRSKFVISSKDQADNVIAALQKWIA